MTVRQLIQELNKFDQDLPVCYTDTKTGKWTVESVDFKRKSAVWELDVVLLS